MDIYRVTFAGYRHDKGNLPPSMRIVPVAGYPGGVTPVLVVNIKDFLMDYIGKNLEWDDVEIQAIEWIGPSLPPIRPLPPERLESS